MASSRRGQFGPASLSILLLFAGGNVAGESLPPLRIDPALLGSAAPRPVASPAAISAVPEAAVAVRAPTAPAPSPIASPAKPAMAATAELPAVARPRSVQAEPVTEKAPSPASPPKSVPATAPAAAAAPAPLPVPTASPAAAPAPVAMPAPAPAPTPTPAPSIVAEIPVVKAVVANDRAAQIPPTPGIALSSANALEPPQVAERPAVAPLYSAHIASGDLPPTVLRPSSRIAPYLKHAGEELPTFIAAERIAGRNDVEVVAQGDVEMRKRNSILRSERMTYRQLMDEVEAEDNVRLSRDGDQISGPRMKMKLDDSTGFFEQPDYTIRRIKTGSTATLWTGHEERESSALTTGHGTATHMDFEGEGKYRLTDATYSTCAANPGGRPDWFAQTDELHLDYDVEEGTARNLTMYFKDVPILYSPWASFSLNNERKSGLLSPTIGSTSQGGLEYTQPIYWNIAPNMDATVAPRIMAKRGTLWKGEYRYLQPSYSGTIEGSYLPNDRLFGKHRGAFSLSHTQREIIPGLSGSVSATGASDDRYFSDLGSGSSVIAQTNLSRQGLLTYSGGWWAANLMAQTYQTLQDPSLPAVVEPYRRLPQLTLYANRGDMPFGMNFAFSGEHVNFRNPSLVEGRRLTLYPQLSLPLQTEIVALTPKLGLHATRYSLTGQAQGTPNTLSRNVPVFSVDSSVTFERDVNWLGGALTQTLEPRLFYLYVPERDQRLIPVFDTALTDFNFAQIFGENRYGGGDRFGDANQATAMLTSRLIDPQSGAESVRVAFGQRFYFSTQKVGLPGETLRSDRQTDFLGSISGRLLPKTYADAGIQYNPKLNRIERLNVGGRYQPELGRVLNASYRYSRDQLGQVDLSGQWPMFGGWHAVGRFNYSTKERRMIESVAGLEFDGGCWVARIVMQRLATLTQQSNTAFFFQLELNGFTKVGSNPLDILKRNVPGYGVINQLNQDATTALQ